jgi:hypothetical protein
LLARAVVDEKYPNRWIGRGGLVAWLPRSPDLTPMDFFTWGTVKDIVYRTPPTTPEGMRQRFTQAFRPINESNQAATVQDSFEEKFVIVITFLCIIIIQNNYSIKNSWCLFYFLIIDNNDNT